LRRWIGEGADLAVSAMVWTEFLCGPLDTSHLASATTLFGEPVPFSAEDAVPAAELFNQSGRRRGSLLDCMIAAVAIRRKAKLATANRPDFQRFHGLRLA
jgi:predicted nucleic acid-binding protein